MEDYQRIIDYDFSNVVLDKKLAIKFKVKRTFSEWRLISVFSHKKGERFIFRTPDMKSTMVGIGYEYTWLLDSNDFLESFDNKSILSGFEELKTGTTFIDIDEHDEEYFGIYGGISDGKNKNTQEWVDFSDTTFVVPAILAVFKEDYVYFTMFFNMKEQDNFLELWRERTSFFNNISDVDENSLVEPVVSVVRDIYPEVWQENIRLALNDIKSDTIKRIVLSRKNQILLKNKVSLASITKYLLSKNRYFMAFESKKSLFLTTNPLASLDLEEDELRAYLYLKQENLFNDEYFVLFDEDEILSTYKEKLEKKLDISFEIIRDKLLMGRKLDVYSVFKAKVKNKDKAIKSLSLLYPMHVIKGYPEEETKAFLDEHNNVGYGFWYAPLGYINKDLDAKFYTCGNMMISFENIITLFTSILLSKGSSYEDVMERTNQIVKSSLKLFDH